MSTTTTHRHRPVTESKPLPFCGPVNPTSPNRAAHGGVRYVQTCKCGATRELLCNWGQHEYGPWRRLHNVALEGGES